MACNNWTLQGELDDYQYRVSRLNINNNYVIKGAAGSGKSILALQRAKYLQEIGETDYYVIVYTRTLRKFIEDGIRYYNIDSNRILYEYEWRSRQGCPEADYFIIDESQDFTESEIKLFKSKARKSIIFFGDTVQQLYRTKNVNGIEENTVTTRRIEEIIQREAESLIFNYRLPKTIARCAELINPTAYDLEERCRSSVTTRPIIKTCSNWKQEMDFIINTIRLENLDCVGILVPTNANVEKVYDYLNENGLTAEVRLRNEEQNILRMNFGNDNPKIMTYWSSKGLQFDTVFLPFCEVSSDFYKNPLYVALTRTSNQLFITHSNSISSFLSPLIQRTEYYSRDNSPVSPINQNNITRATRPIVDDSDDLPF
jgi:DNA helicase IV